MRVLITGINGFVGGHLAERLLASGRWEVWGLARQPALVLPHLAGRVRYVAADLTVQDQVVSALESAHPEVIFHLAGQSNVPRSFADPAGTLAANLTAQVFLFQAILRLRQDPLVLVAASNEIYGAVRPADLPLDEETPLRPVNPYAVSKAAQDLLAFQYFASHRLRTIRLRPFNHIGPRQSDAFVAAAFAAQVARIEAGQQPPLMRVGNLSAERDFTDVRDMVRAYELAALSGEVGEAYNIGSGRATRIQHLLDILMAFSTKDIAVEADPARMRPADVPRVVCDARRFTARTGWEPQIPLEQTLFDTLEYWRAWVREHR
ncbi:MAG TPA: GDP-mannose 4,6-dehydratase [Roseiflexaceae bacterium]|nr:GDP-mannose 4,6-dehydratase [Roseiflexaceae bacterium]